MKKLPVLLAAFVLVTVSFASCHIEPRTEDTFSNNAGVEETTSTPVLDNKQEEETVYTYKRVVVLGVDGAGNFFQNADTPNIDKIFENGSIAYDVTTSTPSISAQCWGSMLHGVTPELHRLTNSIVASQAYDPESLFPSVFRVIRDNDPTCTLASFSTWDPINIGIIEDGLNVHKDTADDDAALCEKICAYIAENDPKLLFVQFDNVDGAGHSAGYGKQKHLEQITITDDYIGKIYEAYEKRGFLEDTLFIVTADHGGFGTSHGGNTDEEMQVMYAAAGKTVQANGAAADMQIRDNASVVLYALGYEQPETWTSLVPSGIFEGVEAGERPVYEIPYEYKHRTHENTDTPAADSGNYITDVLDADRILAYLPMDGDISDAVGQYAASQNGKLYYVEGYYGKGIQFDDGSISLEKYKPAKNSFSVAVWLKTGGVDSDPCLFSNKDWSNGSKPGFVLSLRGSDVKFNLGNGQSRMDAEYPLPLDSRDGWVHIILSVDREANTVNFCYDFGTFVTTKIPDSLKDVSFNAYSNLNIGQDGTGKYGSSLSAVLDDFILIDGALTQDDVASLAAYYGADQ